MRKKKTDYVLEQITCRISSQNKVKTHMARIISALAGRLRRVNPYETVLVVLYLSPIDARFTTSLLSSSA
jgi:hypothetical protein